jgi:hypothetical protein
MPFLGPEPALGIPRCTLREAIKNWTEGQHTRAWIELPGLRHSKLFTGKPCKVTTDTLFKLNRGQLRMITAVYTEHALVRALVYYWPVRRRSNLQMLRNGD